MIHAMKSYAMLRSSFFANSSILPTLYRQQHEMSIRRRADLLVRVSMDQ